MKEWSNGKINKGAFQGTFQIEEQWVIMVKNYKHRSMEQYLSLEIDSAIYKQYNEICSKKRKIKVVLGSWVAVFFKLFASTYLTVYQCKIEIN